MEFLLSELLLAFRRFRLMKLVNFLLPFLYSPLKKDDLYTAM